jgi:ribonuclease P protein subunit POP4
MYDNKAVVKQIISPRTNWVLYRVPAAVPTEYTKKKRNPKISEIINQNFHGAIFKVVRSTTPSFVDLEGIMVQETENTFKILTQENILKIVPKGGCVFSFPYEGKNKKYQVQIYGDNLRFRSYDRSARRFKRKDRIDM